LKPEDAFGQVLKEIRKEKGISQEKLALEGDLDRTFISLLERGQRQPSLTTIIQVSDVLGITPDKLVLRVMKTLRPSN